MNDYTKLSLEELRRLKTEKRMEAAALREYCKLVGDRDPQAKEPREAGLAAQSEYEDICAELIARGEFIVIHRYWRK
jgi:hypothetical protein